MSTRLVLGLIQGLLLSGSSVPLDAMQVELDGLAKPLAPWMTGAEILEGLIGGRFKPLPESWPGFDGAAVGSVICEDWDGWIVIVSPAELESLRIEAYSSVDDGHRVKDLAFFMSAGRWEAY